MTETQTRGRRLEPDYQIGGRAIVLGAREGNIGGAIAERLSRAGIPAYEDDCWHDNGALDGQYLPPEPDGLRFYDYCIITLGTTHMEPFSAVSGADFHKVLYGSLGLPLECARRYVQARGAGFCAQCGGVMRAAGSLRVCEVCGGNDVRPYSPHSKIVFIGSYAHDHPFTHCTSYCVAKAGLDMACRALAWELMPEGFDVFVIHPHHVQGTPMTDEVRRGMMEGVHQMTEEEAEAYSRKDLRMPDILKPEEIAEMVHWLIDNPTARWLSGTAVKMYGGVR